MLRVVRLKVLQILLKQPSACARAVKLHQVLLAGRARSDVPLIWLDNLANERLALEIMLPQRTLAGIHGKPVSLAQTLGPIAAIFSFKAEMRQARP